MSNAQEGQASVSQAAIADNNISVGKDAASDSAMPYQGKGKRTPVKSLSMDDAQQQRRSSSRSIKRKKFDDELVESSISAPKNQRARNLSTSTVVTPTTSTGGSTAALSPIPTPAVSQPAAVSVATPTPEVGGKRPKPITDIGRWKPQDDLALVLAVQQTNDLEAVYRGVKFSCKFTLKEIEDRWYALLYDPTIAKIGVAAMRQLHPETIAQIHRKALFSEAEEKVLKTLAVASQPSLEQFEEILGKHPGEFLPYRTSKCLQAHWTLLKHYHLLPDQALPFPRHEEVMNFSDAEEIIEKDMYSSIQSGQLQKQPLPGISSFRQDDLLSQELLLADRKSKREIRHLENEIPKWQVLVDSITGVAPSDFDNQTLAVLRGRLVRYLMRSKEITLGRSAKDGNVDVDLSLEGPAFKISRKQGLIKLQPNGDFMIANTGKRPFYVDSKPVLSGGNCAKLNNNSVVEISGLRFVFLINQDLISAVRAESLKSQM
ncbi:Microspherule protein 1 [Halotydeus destructor]|nr:Microspherule protein 1 [Halotydeus destructor]